MTAAREQAMNRPTSAHRLPVSSSTPNGVSRGSNPRTHLQSLSVGSINPAHRVTRRKSMSTTTANKDAVVAAMREVTGDNGVESGSYSGRRHTTSRASISGRGASGTYPSFPRSLPSGGAVFGPSGFSTAGQRNGSALTDGPSLVSMPEGEKGHSKPRQRRASEGSHLRKEGKRAGNGELRCETCGKGYKHSSCLTKHLWEHTPEWAITSKLLISKHQQVQLLEAASVLVTMNQESAAESDTSSPAASGSSDPNDDRRSSADTTPPPKSDEIAIGTNSGIRMELDNSKRFSSNSSAYSQSYNSVFSETSGRPYMSHFRQYSTDGRPTTSGTSVSGSYYDDEDQADLAAAVGLLSCSYGTPNSSKPVLLPPDVPPVPPLPAKFLGQHSDVLSGSTIQGQVSRSYQAAVPGKDVDMNRHDVLAEDDEVDHHSHRARSDDEDVGVFGKMEE